jgi:hypothetical protein
MMQNNRIPTDFIIVSFLWLALIIFLITLIAAEPVTSKPNSVLLSVDVGLTPSSLEIEISSSASGEGTFDGYISVDKIDSSIDRVNVTLTWAIDMDMECTVELTPPTMIFSYPGTEPFTARVIIPSDTPKTSGTLTVFAHAEGSLESADASTTATVIVGQFFKVEIGSYTPYVAIGDSNFLSGNLIIYNLGNGEDTFRINLADPSNVLLDHSFEDTVTVPRDGSVTLDFTFYVDEDFDTRSGGYIVLVTFTVTSIGAERKGIRYSSKYSVAVHFPTPEENLRKIIPEIVTLGVALVLVAVIASFIIRKRAHRLRIEDELLAKKIEQVKSEESR